MGRFDYRRSNELSLDQYQVRANLVNPTQAGSGKGITADNQRQGTPLRSINERRGDKLRFELN